MQFRFSPSLFDILQSPFDCCRGHMVTFPRLYPQSLKLNCEPVVPKYTQNPFAKRRQRVLILGESTIIDLRPIILRICRRGCF